MFIGNSIAYGFKRYPHIWDKYYENLALNCGIGGDKVENTLWRAENLTSPSSIDYAVIIYGTNNIDYNEASSIANGLKCVALTLVSKSVQQVIIFGILPRDFVNTIRRDKIKEVNKLLKKEYFKLTFRVFYMEPDSDWVTNKNLLNMKYFYRDHLHLIEEGYEKLAKTISVSLLNAYPYTQDNAKQSNYRHLKHSAICEVPSKPPILEPHLSKSDRKENIPNRRNIFIVKPIKCSIQEVVAESFAAQNLLTVDVVRTAQHCSTRFSRQQEIPTQAPLNRRRRCGE